MTCGRTRALSTAITIPINAEQPNISKNFPIDFNIMIPVPSPVAEAWSITVLQGTQGNI